MGEKMTLEKAAEFMRLVDNGQISGRISEWVGLREACGVIHRHLTQPAQAVDVGAIREVIHYLYSFRHKTPPTWAHLDNAADKLTAAIPKDSNGAEGV